MSKYTTGEIAKLCGVSVRTVQYYDSRNILVPSQLSEGGRRLYSEDDLKKLQIICFLRDAGLSLNSIGALFEDDNPESIISILLDQHEQVIKQELKDAQKKLGIIDNIKRELKEIENFSVETIGDIAEMMKNQQKLKKLRLIMIAVCILMDIIEIATAIFWWQTGIWLPFALGMCIVIALGIWISIYYFKRVTYICPKCHKVFKPKLTKAFTAYHTPRMRRLTCPECGRKGLCVEVYDEKIFPVDKKS